MQIPQKIQHYYSSYLKYMFKYVQSVHMTIFEHNEKNSNDTDSNFT